MPTIQIDRYPMYIVLTKFHIQYSSEQLRKHFVPLWKMVFKFMFHFGTLYQFWTEWRHWLRKFSHQEEFDWIVGTNVPLWNMNFKTMFQSGTNFFCNCSDLYCIFGKMRFTVKNVGFLKPKMVGYQLPQNFGFLAVTPNKVGFG